MKSYGMMRRSLLFAVAAVVCGALAARAGVSWSHVAQGGIPANLVPPEGQAPRGALLGIGAQVYTCRTSATASSGYEWTFTAPAAVLLDDSGAIAGTHFAGPAWLDKDGSSVVGAVIERAPSPDPGAIPWLLLRGTAAGAPGSFGGVSYIQRLDTVGGVAPVGGCDEKHAGAVARVPYSAVYIFYGAPRPAGGAPLGTRRRGAVGGGGRVIPGGVTGATSLGFDTRAASGRSVAPAAAALPPPVYEDWQINEMNARHPEP